MERPSASSSTTTTQYQDRAYPPRTSSASSTHVQGSFGAHRGGDGMRRGHSDGDVLTSRSITDGASSSRDTAQETWMDFVRHSSSDAGSGPLNRAQMDAARASIMAADRRRRMAEHHEDRAKRRSLNSLSFAVPRNGPSTANFTQPGSEDAITQPPNPAYDPPTQRSTERPLPRRPSIDMAQNRRSREITLPRWQADAEVLKCPICGNTFSFWYRKHHCRKCGRVVCANCSPHRITIPRQFIVHPPEDMGPSPSTTENPGVEIVDLTGDDDATEDIRHPQGRPQSSDYRIDPALGGGQEVRLCNPCVPDPNPLPHLPYQSPRIHNLDSFRRPDNQSDQLPPALVSDPLGSTRRSISGRSEHSPTHITAIEGRLARVAPTALSSANRRHSHAQGPQVSLMSPPGYSSIYGSLPDQSAHQVSLNTIPNNAPTNTSEASSGIAASKPATSSPSSSSSCIDGPVTLSSTT